MKKLMVMAVSLAAFNVGFAQIGMKKEFQKEMHNVESKTSEEKAQGQTNKLDSLLALSPEQKTKVHDAALAKFNAIKVSKENHSKDTDKTSMKQEIKASQDKYNTELHTILTPEQQAKLKQHQDEMKAKFNAKKSGLTEPTDTEE